MNERLSKEIWLTHGLKILASKGFGALKAEPMAKSLNVSRGSFYWHFKDVSAFQQAVLDHWRDRTTLGVIRDVNAYRTPRERLRALVSRAGRAETQLEQAIRSWALQHNHAAGIVKNVDAERITFVHDLLVADGMSAAQATSRAHVLYWAYLGKSMTTPQGDAAKFATILDETVDLILQRD